MKELARKRGRGASALLCGILFLKYVMENEAEDRRR